MPLGNRSLIAVLTATHPVAQLDDTGAPNHGGAANPGTPPLPGRANFASHLGDTIQIGSGIQ